MASTAAVSTSRSWLIIRTVLRVARTAASSARLPGMSRKLSGSSSSRTCASSRPQSSIALRRARRDHRPERHGEDAPDAAARRRRRPPRASSSSAVDSATALEQALDGFEGTVVAVSHDRALLRFLHVGRDGAVVALADADDAIETLAAGR